MPGTFGNYAGGYEPMVPNPPESRGERPNHQTYRVRGRGSGSIAQLHHKQMARPRLTGAMQKQATRRACWPIVSYAGTTPRVTQPRTGNIAACTSNCRRL